MPQFVSGLTSHVRLKDMTEPGERETFRERWRWFKTLTFHRCWRRGCWKRSGFNKPGFCDEHHAQTWNRPEVRAWLETLEPVEIDIRHLLKEAPSTTDSI